MADGLVNGIDDRLTVGANFIDVLVKIEDPAEGLLWWRDVIALGAEYDDRRADIAQIDGGAVGGLYLSRRQTVADEQLVDDELNFLRVEIDVSAPPALETEIARRFFIDFGIEIVLLGPKRIRRIHILEILHQPSAIEYTATEIARERREPAAAQKAAGVAHR